MVRACVEVGSGRGVVRVVRTTTGGMERVDVTSALPATSTTGVSLLACTGTATLAWTGAATGDALSLGGAAETTLLLLSAFAAVAFRPVESFVSAFPQSQHRSLSLPASKLTIHRASRQPKGSNPLRVRARDVGKPDATRTACESLEALKMSGKGVGRAERGAEECQGEEELHGGLRCLNESKGVKGRLRPWGRYR